MWWYPERDSNPQNHAPQACMYANSIIWVRSGAPGTNQTCDPALRRSVLCSLSYGGKLAPTKGIEPSWYG